MCETRRETREARTQYRSARPHGPEQRYREGQTNEWSYVGRETRGRGGRGPSRRGGRGGGRSDETRGAPRRRPQH